MNYINHVTVKPGTAVELPEKVDIMSGGYFTVPKGDNGILLWIEAKEGGEITLHGGDSVLAGGNRTLYLNTGNHLIFAESGRYMITEGESKGQIHVTNRGEEMYACVVELV